MVSDCHCFACGAPIINNGVYVDIKLLNKILNFIKKT